MERPSVQQVINAMNSKNYKVYDTPGIDWNLNIVGIRAGTGDSKKFDDLMIVFHRFMGAWDAAYYPITTEPSPHYLKHPLKEVEEKGTAILVEGQYKSAYRIDMHRRGKPRAHKALCQSGGNVRVYRDRNRDGALNLDPGTIEEGLFGINIHRGPRLGQFDPENTDYSAGCQVFADDRHFKEFMQKCEYGRLAFGNSFTYTLLHESDISA